MKYYMIVVLGVAMMPSAAWAQAAQPDRDGDDVIDADDNCPGVANENQTNGDGDRLGDACDDDDDGDGVPETGRRAGCDNCPGARNPNQVDTDRDGLGDACDDDDDGDGVIDTDDSCPLVANAGPSGSDQVDTDGDGVGDACDCGGPRTPASCRPARRRPGVIRTELPAPAAPAPAAEPQATPAPPPPAPQPAPVPAAVAEEDRPATLGDVERATAELMVDGRLALREALDDLTDATSPPAALRPEATHDSPTERCNAGCRVGVTIGVLAVPLGVAISALVVALGDGDMHVGIEGR